MTMKPTFDGLNRLTFVVTPQGTVSSTFDAVGIREHDGRESVYGKLFLRQWEPSDADHTGQMPEETMRDTHGETSDLLPKNLDGYKCQDIKPVYFVFRTYMGPLKSSVFPFPEFV